MATKEEDTGMMFLSLGLLGLIVWLGVSMSKKKKGTTQP